MYLKNEIESAVNFPKMECNFSLHTNVILNYLCRSYYCLSCFCRI